MITIKVVVNKLKLRVNVFKMVVNVIKVVVNTNLALPFTKLLDPIFKELWNDNILAAFLDILTVMAPIIATVNQL